MNVVVALLKRDQSTTAIQPACEPDATLQVTALVLPVQTSGEVKVEVGALVIVRPEPIML